MSASQYRVEGDWKNFRFKRIRPGDFPRVMVFLRNNFYTKEPLHKAACYDDCSEEDWLLENLLLLEAIEQKFSFYAIEVETNKVAAVRIGTIHRRGRKSLGSNLHSMPLRKIFPLCEKLRSESRIYEQFKVDSYVDFFITSVGKEFLGEGIAFEMYKRSIEMVRANGFSLISGCYSNPYLRKIASRLCFQELCRQFIVDHKDSNGNSVFSPAASEDFISVMVLRLQ